MAAQHHLFDYLNERSYGEQTLAHIAFFEANGLSYLIDDSDILSGDFYNFMDNTNFYMTQASEQGWLKSIDTKLIENLDTNGFIKACQDFLKQ
jgi:hypothetical protein